MYNSATSCVQRFAGHTPSLRPLPLGAPAVAAVAAAMRHLAAAAKRKLARDLGTTHSELRRRIPRRCVFFTAPLGKRRRI